MVYSSRRRRNKSGALFMELRYASTLRPSSVSSYMRGPRGGMTFSKLFATLAILLWLPGHAISQTPRYPVKPMRMVVGYAAGGGADIMARLIAQQITDATGQQVIVENRAGASQNIAAEYVAKSPNDGYMLFMIAAALAVNVTLYPKLTYDLVKDFAPVAVFATSPLLLLVQDRK